MTTVNTSSKLLGIIKLVLLVIDNTDYLKQSTENVQQYGIFV